MAECECCGDEYEWASTHSNICLSCRGAGCDPEKRDRCRRWW